MNRAMLIGAIGSGKSTLTHALLGRNVPAMKTQTLIYYDWIVDTPGEYIENPLHYRNIMATALEVTHVLFLQDATKRHTIFPPGFSTGITKWPIGVVTKADDPKADVSLAIQFLKQVIPEGPIVISSSVEGRGLEEIRQLVKCSSMAEIKHFAIENTCDHLFFHDFLK